MSDLARRRNQASKNIAHVKLQNQKRSTSKDLSKDVRRVLRAERRTAEAWASQAARLAEEGLAICALLAEARSIAEGGSPDRLRGWLGEQPPSAAAEADARAAVEKMARFGDTDVERMIARFVEGILDRGSPSALLEASAITLVDHGEIMVARAMAQASCALASRQEQEAVSATRVQLLLDVGLWSEAESALDRLAEVDTEASARLRTLLAVLSHPFDFRAAQYLAGDDDDDATLSPLSLAEAQAGVRSIARRIATIREGLVELVGEAPWLPDISPIVPAMTGDGPHLADDYVGADETATIADRVLELRAEWARLSWALAALGKARVEWVEAIERPRSSMDFVDTFTTARFNLLCDVVERVSPSPSDELEKRLLASTFAGTPLAELEPMLASIWLDETEAALSGLRWAMGRTETPWSPE